MTPWKCLAPWVLLLVQESNLLYINLDYKIYSTILNNDMQKTLDAIIGEKQSAAIKNRMILYTFPIIRNVIDILHKSNSYLA